MINVLLLILGFLIASGSGLYGMAYVHSIDHSLNPKKTYKRIILCSITAAIGYLIMAFAIFYS